MCIVYGFQIARMECEVILCAKSVNFIFTKLLTEHVPSYVTERCKNRWSKFILGNKALHFVKVITFLFPHLTNYRSELVILGQYR